MLAFGFLFPIVSNQTHHVLDLRFNVLYAPCNLPASPGDDLPRPINVLLGQGGQAEDGKSADGLGILGAGLAVGDGPWLGQEKKSGLSGDEQPEPRSDLPRPVRRAAA